MMHLLWPQPRPMQTRPELPKRTSASLPRLPERYPLRLIEGGRTLSGSTMRGRLIRNRARQQVLRVETKPGMTLMFPSPMRHGGR